MKSEEQIKEKIKEYKEMKQINLSFKVTELDYERYKGICKTLGFGSVEEKMINDSKHLMNSLLSVKPSLV